MTARYALKMVCPSCMTTYDVEVLNPTVSADGEITGYASSSADFCEGCGSSELECLGAVEVAA